MPYRGLLEVYSVHWRHSQQPPAHWTVCSLADQTFVDVSLALVHAPGLSCRHVTRSAHRASGYQLAAICYSWCGDINKLTFLEPSQQQRLIMYQDNNQTTKTATCATPFLTARHSVSFAQGSSHQPSAWTGELPLTIRSGKREHHRPIITTDQLQQHIWDEHVRKLGSGRTSLECRILLERCITTN